MPFLFPERAVKNDFLAVSLAAIESYGNEAFQHELHEQITKLGMHPVSTVIRRASEVMHISLSDAERSQVAS